VVVTNEDRGWGRSKAFKNCVILRRTLANSYNFGTSPGKSHECHKPLSRNSLFLELLLAPCNRRDISPFCRSEIIAVREISDRRGKIGKSNKREGLDGVNDDQRLTRLTFRRLHPQLFHPFSDLLEVCVRDSHGIGHEFVTWWIGQRVVTAQRRRAVGGGLASGHLNCSQDNTDV